MKTFFDIIYWESEWLFGTAAGRRQLQDSARFGRLVVAVLRRGHVFQSLDAVKEELTHSAKMLVPNGFSGQIPFLSLGSDVGRRVKVFQGCSQLSGAFVVEDVDVEGATHRRLVFLDNQFLVQSEAKLKSVKRKNKTRTVVDFGHISLYHSFMCVGVQLSKSVFTNVAVLGLGGGSLCMFLRRCFDKLKVTAVEIDPAMLELARDYFELKADESLDVQIKDGLDFLRDEAGKGSRFEAVLFDMDSKDRTLGLSCPPKQFLDNHVLEDVKTILTTDGHLIINLVCRDPQLQASIIETLKQHFEHLVSVKLYEEVNEIVLCTNSDKVYNSGDFEGAVKCLNSAARQRNLVPVRCVDLKDFLQSVNVIS